MRPGFALPPFVRGAVVAGLLATGPSGAAALEGTTAPVHFATEDLSQAEVRFTLCNASDAPLTISGVESSCRCTVVATPARPWILPPQAQGELVARVDLRGQRGLKLLHATGLLR